MTNGILDSGQKIVTDGLVLNYDVAQLRSYPTTGTVLTDLSANGNTGTLINGVAFNSDNGGSLAFDGVNDYVNAGTNSSINFERTNSFSLSAWVNVNSLSAFRAIIVKMASTTLRGYFFDVELNGRIGFILRNTQTTNDMFVTTTNSILINTWNLVTVTYNGNSLASGVSFYINGILQTNIVIRNGLTATILNTAIVSIGARIAINDGFMNGRISQTQIYNRALTSAEVLQNFNANRSRYGLDSGIVTDGLILNYDVAQLQSYPTTGTTITDLSGNGNNGTLINGVAFNSDNGGSLVFDGVNDYVNITNTISNPTLLTVSLFIKPTTSITPGVIWSYRSTTTQLLQLTIQDSTTIFFQIRGSGNVILNISMPIIMGIPSMVTAIFNKITGVHTLYVNNNSVNGTLNLSGQTLNSTQQYLGQTSQVVVPYLGNIYTTQIYNRALSSTEVLQNFNANRSRYGL